MRFVDACFAVLVGQSLSIVLASPSERYAPPRETSAGFRYLRPIAQQGWHWREWENDCHKAFITGR